MERAVALATWNVMGGSARRGGARRCEVAGGGLDRRNLLGGPLMERDELDSSLSWG